MAAAAVAFSQAARSFDLPVSSPASRITSASGGVFGERFDRFQQRLMRIAHAHDAAAAGQRGGGGFREQCFRVRTVQFGEAERVVHRAFDRTHQSEPAFRHQPGIRAEQQDDRRRRIFEKPVDPPGVNFHRVPLERMSESEGRLLFVNKK